MFGKQKSISEAQIEDSPYELDETERAFTSNYAEGSSYSRDLPFSGFKKLLLQGPWNE